MTETAKIVAIMTILTGCASVLFAYLQWRQGRQGRSLRADTVDQIPEDLPAQVRRDMVVSYPLHLLYIRGELRKELGWASSRLVRPEAVLANAYKAFATEYLRDPSSFSDHGAELQDQVDMQLGVLVKIARKQHRSWSLRQIMGWFHG